MMERALRSTFTLHIHRRRPYVPRHLIISYLLAKWRIAEVSIPNGLPSICFQDSYPGRGISLSIKLVHDSDRAYPLFPSTRRSRKLVRGLSPGRHTTFTGSEDPRSRCRFKDEYAPVCFTITDTLTLGHDPHGSPSTAYLSSKLDWDTGFAPASAG